MHEVYVNCVTKVFLMIKTKIEIEFYMLDLY